MTYARSPAFGQVLAGARRLLIKPSRPWRNGKAKRFNRTLQEGWAYRLPYTSNRERAEALTAWLDFYNRQRAHRPSEAAHPPAGVNNLLCKYS